MTRRRETALAHPVPPQQVGKHPRGRARQLRRRRGHTAAHGLEGRRHVHLPELQHRSRGQSVHSIVLGKRVEVK